MSQTRNMILTATPEQQQKICLLSDNELYQAGCQFVTDNGIIDSNKQITSLIAHTQTWDDLENFIKHQRDRDWSGRQQYYKTFYTALRNHLTELRQRVERNWFPPEANLTKAQRRDWVNYFSILVAREFLDHLAAENFYQGSKE